MSQTYNYSLAGDFGNGLSPEQLHNEILAATGISDNFSGIVTDDDTIGIIFATGISGTGISILDNLISNHNPITLQSGNISEFVSNVEATGAPTINDDISKNYRVGSFWIDNTSRDIYMMTGSTQGAAQWKKLTQVKPDGKITVSASGDADYTTIKDALAVVQPGQEIFVHPGIYYEANPLVIPDETTLTGAGVIAVKVVATNPTAPIFDVGQQCLVSHFSFIGAAAPGGCAIRFDAAGKTNRSMIHRMQIINCDIGVLSEMTSYNPYPPTNIAVEVFMTSTTTTTVNTAILCRDGSSLRFSSCGIGGNPIQQITRGLVCEGVGSEVYIQDSGVSYCETAFCCSGGSNLAVSGGICNHNDRAFCVEGTGTDVQVLDVIGTLVNNSNQYDLDVQTNKVDKITFSGCRLISDKINNPHSLKILSSFVNDQEENKSQTILGELNVGSHTFPAETSLGEGACHIIGLNVFQASATGATGGMNDITTEAKSRSQSSFDLFLGPTGGNCVYVGGDTIYPGYKILMNTEIIGPTGTDLISIEYWNGTGWNETRVMWSLADPPYYPYAHDIFKYCDQAGTAYHLRLGKVSGWTKSTINSSEKYWTRMILNTDVSSVPNLEQIKLHTNSMEVNVDGFVEYFGKARPLKRLPWDLNIAKPAMSSPFDQDIYLSDNIDVGRTENGFSNTNTDRTGLNTYLPYEIDTSCPIRVMWSWYATTNSGNIRWVIRWATSFDGDLIYTSTAGAPDLATNEQSLTLVEAVPAVANSQKSSVVELDICRIVPIKADSKIGELLWLTIERNGGHADDTCTGNVVLIQLAPYYFARSEGFHIEE